MADARVIAEDKGFCEGPAYLGEGRLAFTSVSLGRVYLLRDGAPAAEHDTGGGPNGLTTDRQGTLYVAQNGGIRPGQARVPGGIQRIQDGRVEYLVTGLDAPNDLCFGPDGRLYFTDSRGMPDRNNLDAHPPGRVFVYDLAGQKMTMLLEGPRFTNGIAFGFDNTLYVADTFSNCVLQYTLAGDTLIPRGVFAELDGGPDGMCFAEDGRLYAACPGLGAVQITHPSGKPAGRLDCGEGSLPTNCCFGGAGNRTLFVTAAGKGQVLAFDTEVPGLPLYPFR